jgi:cellulose synthase/poly-beta-1,6-N-acetylglucosamine synthase-like glycosyltransferase
MICSLNFFESFFALILIAGGVFYFAVCMFALIGFFRKHGFKNDYRPSVSVIIPARNEEKNIAPLLSGLTAQTYPPEKIEIVVVDDSSMDSTAEIVREYIQKNPCIKLIEAKNSKLTYAYKKKAVCEGINSSSGEIIVTTDADCRVPEDWIERKIAFFVPETDLVAGDVILNGNGLIGAFEVLEMSGLQAMAAGLMNVGFPVTCNGANLAYRRSAFVKVGGFEDIGSFVSGDDDLLMQKIARNNRKGVVYISGEKNATTTGAASGLKDFITRRTRWASKTANYPSLAAIFMLSCFFVFFVVSVLFFIFAVLGIWDWRPVLFCFGLKILGDIPLVISGPKKTEQKKYLFLFPAAEILHIPYIIFVTLKGYFGSFEWSGRKSTVVYTHSGN